MVDDLLPSKRPMKVRPSDPRPSGRKKRAMKRNGIHGQTENTRSSQGNANV